MTKHVFCRDKHAFVATEVSLFCSDKIMFVATNILSRQKFFPRQKYRFSLSVKFTLLVDFSIEAVRVEQSTQLDHKL